MTAVVHQVGPDPQAQRRPHLTAGSGTVEFVVPVFNEQADLETCIRRLEGYLDQQLPYRFSIVIADNASTDDTPQIAARLAQEIPAVTVVRLAEKGRGRALATVWQASTADVVAYMDVDLSTDLAAILPLLAPLLSGHSDLAIGTRLRPGSRVVRGAKREVLSRCYNVLLRGTLSTGFSDAQCGFKAMRRDVAVRLLPYVEDTGWFFDTELLVLAERSGLRIHEVPVDWVDDPDSRVELWPTVRADLHGIVRLAGDLARGRLPVTELRASLGRAALEQPDPRRSAQLVSFAAIGILSTVAYLLLFALARTGWNAQVSNVIALVATAVLNTGLNRRFTFGVTGGSGLVRHHAQGLAVLAIGLLLTSGSLYGLNSLTSTPSAIQEVAVLVAGNAVATLGRFLLFRHWVFGSVGRQAQHGSARARAVAR